MTTPSSACMKRINVELKKLKEYEHIYTVKFNESNPSDWVVTIQGPEDTPYHGGSFELSFKFPPNYPFTSPNVKFITKVYHPNISNTGEVCLSILKGKWSPATTSLKILESISSLLVTPNPDDPLEVEISQQYTNNKEQFDLIAKDWTIQYASKIPS